MKRYFTFLILTVVPIFISNDLMSQHFNKGVNLTNWFQSSSSTSINFGKYTKQDLENIKSLGCDVIRLPINMHPMTSGAPNYKVDTLLFYFLDQVVDWAEELEINLIIDNHSFDPAVSTSLEIENILIPVWKQYANHFKGRSNRIFYEILNEPHGINDNLWNSIQKNVVSEIRKIDSIHTIIVGPAEWNSYHNLDFMPIYSDTNLIYTFHFYDPFLFTHQGATWTDPSMIDLSGVPFPYSQQDMPTLPSSLIGTWVQSSYNSYSVDGSISKVKELIDIAVNFKNSRNVELFCGEFGVYIPNSNNEDRIFWYEVVRKQLEDNNISWTTWDYQGGFGLFKAGSDEQFNSDLNIPLINALGLNEVEQNTSLIKPDSTNIPIYIDFIESGINESSWISNGELNYYSDDNPAMGNYCISIFDLAQYNYVGFNFIPNRNMNYLRSSTNSFLSLYIKGTNSNTVFDIRFLDSKTDVPEDHPWRISYAVNSSIVPFDGSWHKLEIPLTNFIEQGSWDNNTWYDPIGEFDWQDVDRLEIVAEQNSLEGINLWFDDIRIINPDIVSVEYEFNIDKFYLDQNYPNPFNPTTTIKFSIPSTSLNKKSKVSLVIFDVLGRKIKTLVYESKSSGTFAVNWDASNESSGVYFYQLHAGKYIQTKKMLLIK